MELKMTSKDQITQQRIELVRWRSSLVQAKTKYQKAQDILDTFERWVVFDAPIGGCVRVIEIMENPVEGFRISDEEVTYLVLESLNAAGWKFHYDEDEAVIHVTVEPLAMEAIRR
jgi:hypothetical protein